MTNFGTNSLNQHATGLIIPPWVIIGKKTDVSSEYEDFNFWDDLKDFLINPPSYYM